MQQPFEQVPPVNIWIADQLEGMIDLHARDYHRKKAYRNAVAAIRDYMIPITSGKMAKDSIKGVGDSSAAAIDQILATGQVQILAQQPPSEQEKNRVIKLFTKIPQVGIERATHWYNNNYRTYQDLVTLYQNGGMTPGQMLGFQHLLDLQQKVSRAEVDAYVSYLHSVLDPYGVEFTVAGSYRRLRPTSGDVDIVVRSVTTQGQQITLQSLVATLTQTGLIIGSFTPDATAKFMGLSRLPVTSPPPSGQTTNQRQNLVRHFDIRLIDPQNWAYALLYFTGSGEFNKRMRDVVRQMGYKLSEYGIFLKDTDQSALPPGAYMKTEEEIFAFFGFKYLRPEERTDKVVLEFLQPGLQNFLPVQAPVVQKQQEWFRPVDTLLVYMPQSLLQLLQKTSLPRKVAGFDLDHTLVENKLGHTFTHKPEDIKVMTGRVSVLKQLIEKGYVVVIFTNQKSESETKRTNTFAKLQRNVELLEVPLLLLATLADDVYRKPGIGMWKETEKILVQVDKTQSFFCGDAAGRATDFNNTDLQFAQNVGVTFYTPEQLFV